VGHSWVPEFLIFSLFLWIYECAKKFVGFKALTAVSTKMAVFWVVTLCSLVEVYQYFSGSCCLHRQGTWWWRQQVSLKCWWTSTRLHGVTTQKTAIFIFEDNLFFLNIANIRRCFKKVQNAKIWAQHLEISWETNQFCEFLLFNAVAFITLSTVDRIKVKMYESCFWKITDLNLLPWEKGSYNFLAH
jgi:hypothetical protein